MASADKISGEAGACTYNSVTIVITNWEITVEADVKNVTDSSSTTWEENLANGFKRWSGSFEGFYLDGTVSTTITTGAALSLVLTAEAAVTFTGNAILSGKTLNLSVHGGDAAKVAYNFVGDGSLVEANP